MAGTDIPQPAGGDQAPKLNSNTSTPNSDIDEEGMACLMQAVTIARGSTNALTVEILKKRLRQDGWAQETIDMAIGFWSSYIQEKPLEEMHALKNERN